MEDNAVKFPQNLKKRKINQKRKIMRQKIYMEDSAHDLKKVKEKGGQKGHVKLIKRSHLKITF